MLVHFLGNSDKNFQFQMIHITPFTKALLYFPHGISPYSIRVFLLLILQLIGKSFVPLLQRSQLPAQVLPFPPKEIGTI